MGLASPDSAILSAVIFNALIIVVLIPLALKGVKLPAAGRGVLLRRNLLIYGLGGVIVPFVGIKLIDLLLSAPRPGLKWRCDHEDPAASGADAVRAADRC